MFKLAIVFALGIIFGFGIRYFKKIVQVLKKGGLSYLLFKVYDYIKVKVFSRHKPNTHINEVMTVKKLISNKFINTHAIQFLKQKEEDYRFNIVLDTLNKNCFFGGVATSLILATLFCNKHQFTLRIITRFSDTNPDAYFSFLEMVNIPKPEKVEFYSDFERLTYPYPERLEVTDLDIFLSTSWWSSQAINAVNFRKSFFYILQEFEPFFYPNGDEQVMCEGILEQKNIHFLINSSLLYDFYKNKNYSSVINTSKMFEPAFPQHMYFANEASFKPKAKRKLLFYARPNHLRNLFYTGLKVLDEALLTGIVNEEWEIYFAGEEIAPLQFSNGIKPIIKGQMNWEEYLEFVREIDLCFSLMHTPHPSYIPLDVASSGGVVLTNQYANKKNIPYSQNIVCATLDMPSMLQGFKEAIALSKDLHTRESNYNQHSFARSWETTFAEILDYMNAHK